MGFQAKKLTILSIFAMLMTLSTCSLDATFKRGLEYFSHNIFHELAKTHSQDNIIFSPFSAQACLAMVRMGADGETAAELDRAMGFSGKSSETLADNYYSLLSQYETSNIVHLANKVYVMKDYELQDKYNDILSAKFFAAAEPINFSQSVNAADTINNWVESKTNHLIKDVIKSDMLSSDTRVVLLNAIHFKGEWLKAFDESKTKETDFYIDAATTVKVPMMFQKNYFEFAYLNEVKSLAVRLPYKDSDLSMLIFLPFERTGLSEVEDNLKNASLESLTKKMKHTKVLVSLPKFKAEFTVELTDTLKKLNLHHLFENANFGKMLTSPEPLAISHVVQKAFIEVTEKGTEAAAATGLIAEGRMMPPRFNADHPFHYFILNTENVVLFEGNVLNFKST